MKRVTATEAARGFSDLLDAVEHRKETFLVNRGGKPVARIGPASGSNGHAVKKLLRTQGIDKDWQHELDELRAGLAVQERSWKG